MIVTITMNPAVDKSTTVEKLIPEKKLRCANLMTEAGGGGINVSKAINELGIIDTSGMPLQLAAKEGVYLLKPNLSELSGLVGKEYLQLDEIDEAAHYVIEQGHCEVVVVSMGSSGAIVVAKDGYERITAPEVKKLSTVGAGDSMVDGMVWMLGQGKSIEAMARFGVACGTAATMNSGTQLFKKEDIFNLYESINKHAEKKWSSFSSNQESIITDDGVQNTTENIPTIFVRN